MTDLSREAVLALAAKLKRTGYPTDLLDDAAATLRGLLAELERVKGELEATTVLPEGYTMLPTIDLDTLRQQLAAAQGALHKYGSHYAMCLIDSDDAICSCGLETALGEKP